MLVKIIAIASAWIIAVLPAAAQQYPARPVRVIVAFPAGSGTDVVARIVTEKLSAMWGQKLIVDNHAGAGGSIGSAIAARAAPDGYTLLINSSAHTINPAFYATLPYNTVKDFVDIMALTSTPIILANNITARIRTVDALVAEARIAPGRLNFASAGMGSGTHLNLEKFKLAAGIRVTHIPYQGSAEAITAVLGDRSDFYFCPLSACLPFVRDGKLRGIAVTTLSRSKLLPTVPTIAESGIPHYEFVLWFGLWGPAGLPPSIVARIRTDTRKALAITVVRNRLVSVANELMDIKPGDFARFVRQEISDNASILRSAGINPQ